MVWFTDVNNQYAISVAGWVAMAFAPPICITRLFMRWKSNRGWKLSDYSMLVGGILILSMQIMMIVEMHRDETPERTVEELGRRLVFCSITASVTWAGLALIRVSILLTFAEIFFYRFDRIAIGLGLLLCFIVSFTIEPTIFYACLPRGSHSDPHIVYSREAVCKKFQRPFALTGCALSTFLDLYIIVIPIHRVTKMNLPSNRNRWLVLANISVGGLAIAASAYQLGDMIQNVRDITLIEIRIMRNVLLSMIEGHAAAVAGSLIPLQPSFIRFLQWVRNKSLSVSVLMSLRTGSDESGNNGEEQREHPSMEMRGDLETKRKRDRELSSSGVQSTIGLASQISRVNSRVETDNERCMAYHREEGDERVVAEV